MMRNSIIRKIGSAEVAEAMNLVWNVFSEFEAPEYSEDGIREFKNYIVPGHIQSLIQNEALDVWGCYDNQVIIGVIAMRPPCHISLLFVDKAHHRKGIARTLFHTAINYYKENKYCWRITVNSSPYAREIYHKLGFIDTDTEQTVNGIRFIPMSKPLRTE